MNSDYDDDPEGIAFEQEVWNQEHEFEFVTGE
jgi:hypothetical protein